MGQLAKKFIQMGRELADWIQKWAKPSRLDSKMGFSA